VRFFITEDGDLLVRLRARENTCRGCFFMNRDGDCEGEHPPCEDEYDHFIPHEDRVMYIFKEPSGRRLRWTNIHEENF